MNEKRTIRALPTLYFSLSLIALFTGILLIKYGFAEKYRETTPQERIEFDSTRAQFIKDHQPVEVRVLKDSLIIKH